MQSDKNKMKNKDRNQRKINEAFFKLRNYQVYQQGILLALLNKHFEITLQIPTKRSVVTRQYFKINELRRGNDSIKVEEYVEQRCKEKYLQDLSNGIPEKTARRRYDTNKITEQLHLLIDLLTEFGYSFVSKWTSGKKGAQIVETIQKVISPNVTILNKEIPVIGVQTNDYLTHHCFDLKKAVIQCCDRSFLSSLSV
ncbi:hypothetical protein EDI_104220 [Entamoeba dispar SAW760]|uniref:Uncharacterized protein n=1 Tax=Entamoeba dispar (strain ATCC PRA-260 / SAW760) TaxID=370354 RepID=B0ECL5_ENTDS|nr:uncharacterized protein EDI_104220 [Entamoeba dispar SAW760]EDR27731.1 hypothetical protein EDI_104220 [Entamoeba dispar SAW760]|eukprot:EDR27731.1 hypothetical protein EDI_104220 [Entamoeba dispar SAW760]